MNFKSKFPVYLFNASIVFSITFLSYNIFQLIVKYNELNKGFDDLLREEIYTSIIINIIFLMITLLLKVIQDSLSDHISNFERLFRGAVSRANIKERVTHIGPSSTALIHLQEDLKRASSVINTNLAIRDISSQSEQSLKLYKTFFESNKSLHWRDLVGLPDLFDDRYRDLKMPKSGNKTLQLDILRHSSPVVNFIQLQIKGNYRTYFGWIGFSENESDIYMTDNFELNSLFRDHYCKMFDAYQWPGGDSIVEVRAGGVLETIQRETDLVDKVGCWLTIEWEKNEEVISPISYGLIKIEYQNNKINIIPRIYDTNFLLKKDTKHIDAVKNYGSRLYFDFSYEEEDRHVSGMCSYEFRGGDDHNLKKIIKGQLHRYSDWTLNKITGISITEKDFNNLVLHPELISREKARVPRQVD